MVCLIIALWCLQETNPQMEIGLETFYGMPLNLSLVEGKGRRGSQIRKREKLSCDAVLTDVSAHRMGNYKQGMKLQRCHVLGLFPTVLISHYM